MKMNSMCFYTRIINDPDDNKFIECDITDKADYIVSGDKHLFRSKRV